MEPKLFVLQRRPYVESLDRCQPGWRDAWFYRYLGLVPRAHYARESNAVYVLRGHERNQKLLAHEYGHFLGYRHPRGLAYLVDIMGYGLRVRDERNVMLWSATWRRSVSAA